MKKILVKYGFFMVIIRPGNAKRISMIVFFKTQEYFDFAQY